MAAPLRSPSVGHRPARTLKVRPGSAVEQTRFGFSPFWWLVPSGSCVLNMHEPTLEKSVSLTHYLQSSYTGQTSITFLMQMSHKSLDEFLLPDCFCAVHALFRGCVCAPRNLERWKDRFHIMKLSKAAKIWPHLIRQS